MNDIKFFSKSNYIALPSKKKPKVFLAIDSCIVKKKSFELYNPFSMTAKVLKFCASLLPVFNLSAEDRSEFIEYFESRLSRTLTSSVYYSTDEDKAVVQLQSGGECVGYLKIGLTEKGIERVGNEYKALTILPSDHVPGLIDHGSFQGLFYIITQEIVGTYSRCSSEVVANILKGMIHQDNKSFRLKEHPRVLSLHEDLKKIGNIKILSIFEGLELNGTVSLAYEHGDFAPWNIVKTKSGHLLIDFEYFIYDGISSFDLIKYHFQIGRLLKGLRAHELIIYLEGNIKIDNFNELLTLYLLKEICLNFAQNKETDYELDLIDFLKK